MYILIYSLEMIIDFINAEWFSLCCSNFMCCVSIICVFISNIIVRTNAFFSLKCLLLLEFISQYVFLIKYFPTWCANLVSNQQLLAVCVCVRVGMGFELAFGWQKFKLESFQLNSNRTVFNYIPLYWVDSNSFRNIHPTLCSIVVNRG